MVQGIDDVAVHFSKCCSPVPGDEIVGFVTRGRGVSLHRTDCINIINLPESDRVRLIEAEWNLTPEQSGKENYFAEWTIFAHNRTGIIVDVSRIFTENKVELVSLSARTSKQGTATIDVGFEVNSTEQMNTIMAKLRNIEGVTDMKRKTG